MKSLATHNQSHYVLRIFACIALLIGLVSTLIGFFSLDGFWEDEFYQIAFMNEGFTHFFIQVPRLDQHPPFHYLQLKLWGTIFSSDKGLLLNSVIWHLISCYVIFRVGRDWLGTSTAVLAVAFFALAPQVVASSVALRMYSMVPALAVGAWWANVKVLTIDEKRWWPLAAMVVLQLILGYSHAIGFYFVAWIALAAAVQVFCINKSTIQWKRWCLAQSCAAILLLPLVVSAVVRISMPGQAESGGNNDPGSLVDHLGGMVAGWGINSGMGLALGAAFYFLALGFGLWNKPTRYMSAVLLLGPYTFSAIIALFLAPMFKTPVYSAMLVPFACLAFAGGLMALEGVLGSCLAALVLSVMTAAVFPASHQLLGRTSPYKPIVAELKRRALPGDVVAVSKDYLYWAVMRYAVGSNWGSPLEIMPAVNEKWKKLLDKIDPDMASSLKLIPKSSHVTHEGITYVIGENALKESRQAKRVWIIERISYPIPVKLSEGFVDKGVLAEFGNREVTQLHLFERP